MKIMYLVINPALHMGLRDYPGSETCKGGIAVPVTAVRAAIAEAQELAPEAISRHFNLGIPEATVFLPALITLERFLDGVAVALCHAYTGTGPLRRRALGGRSAPTGSIW